MSCLHMDNNFSSTEYSKDSLISGFDLMYLACITFLRCVSLWDLCFSIFYVSSLIMTILFFCLSIMIWGHVLWYHQEYSVFFFFFRLIFIFMMLLCPCDHFLILFGGKFQYLPCGIVSVMLIAVSNITTYTVSSLVTVRFFVNYYFFFQNALKFSSHKWIFHYLLFLDVLKTTWMAQNS